jgi:glycerol-3-phosphate dehydrogenase (NAD(P)+)
MCHPDFSVMRYTKGLMALLPDQTVSVLGAGSWGTALAFILAAGGRKVTLWDRSQSIVDEINAAHTNSKYLPGLSLPESITGVSDIALAATSTASMIVIAVPSGAIRDVTADLAGVISYPVTLISAAKGLEAESSMTMTEVIQSLVPSEHLLGIVALSGPNLAKEVIKGVPSVCIAACKDSTAARSVQELFMSETFRVYTHSDIRGVELAGALKNVLAIGAGVCEGLGYGDNTRAAMMTRGLMEMTQIGVAAGAQPMTFLGIAGVGDLMATSASKLSRNYRVGMGIAHGDSLISVLSGIGQAAEGVPTSTAAYTLARKLSVTTPLFDTIHDVIHCGLAPKSAVSLLMRRPPRDESTNF